MYDKNCPSECSLNMSKIDGITPSNKLNYCRKAHRPFQQASAERGSCSVRGQASLIT